MSSFLVKWQTNCVYSTEAWHQGRQTIKCNSRLDERPPFHITFEGRRHCTISAALNSLMLTMTFIIINYLKESTLLPLLTSIVFFRKARDFKALKLLKDAHCLQPSRCARHMNVLEDRTTLRRVSYACSPTMISREQIRGVLLCRADIVKQPQRPE